MPGLPLCELHLHLEGALNWQTVRRFHPDGAALPATPPWLGDPAGFRDFDAFRDVFLRILRPATGTPESVEAHVREVLLDLAQLGVRCVEAICGPRFHLARGMTLPEVVQAMERGVAAARARTGLRVGLLYGLNRHYPALDEVRQCETVLELAGPGASGLFIGVDLQGDDRIEPAPEFAAILRRVRAAGMVTRVHAGELAGPASVRHALDCLAAEQISHGIGAAADAGLLRELAARRVPLHVCPTSNVRLGAVADYASHPLPRMLDAGCCVTLNSDDPLLFGATIADEHRLARSRLGLGVDALEQMTRTAFETARMPEPERARVLAEVAAESDAIRRAEASSDCDSRREKKN